MLKEKLFWEKFRPNSINPGKGNIPMILLPRIKKVVDTEDLCLNLLFYGTAGTGKSTLANIITENTNCLKINGSKDNGINVVREQIDEHCRLFGLFQSDSGIKTVYVDEFDGTTPEFRKALRSFMEDYKQVRFVVTVNNLSKISRTQEDIALLTRFNLVNFDHNNKKEETWLKEMQFKFIKSISKNIDFQEVNDEVITKIVNNNYPKFRQTIQVFQELYITKDFERFENAEDSSNEELYDFMLDGECSLEKNFQFVLQNYGDNTQELIDSLGRKFFRHVTNNVPELAENLIFMQMYIKLMKECGAEYYNVFDPELHMIYYITEIKNLLNQ